MRQLCLMRRRLAPFIALFVPVALAGAETPLSNWRLVDATKVGAEGAALSLPGFPDASWTPAVVPGTVLTSLVRAGVYPEPLFGLNNLSIPESLSRRSYWYRAEFDVPKGNRRTWMRFDGVNYMAEVWVEGHPVGTVRGAFARGLFDITPWVRPGNRAAVAVKVLPPNHPGTPLEQTLAAGTGRNGGDTGADGVTFASTVGWDWIPGIRDRDMGLWQGVALVSTGPVTIHDPYVRTTLPLPRLDSARLAVTARLTNDTDAPQRGVLEGRVDGTRLAFRREVALAPHESKGVEETLAMDKPKLWWPNGYGTPNLYRLKLRFVQGRSASDESQTAFGVRQMAYFRGDSKDMTLQVNGVPVMARGGNWGIDEAMKRSPVARLDAQVRLHHDANCNFIRNWVGQSTQEDFYAACDKYGMMIWDDFWLANPVDGPVPVDNDLFLANAREKILRYRNHPSIAVWCGRNEGMPPPVIEAGLEALTKDLDGTRFYQPHSSSLNGVSGGGPYGQVPFSRYFTLGSAMHTEVGAPSIPTLESIKGMMPEKDWWPINDDWAYHDLLRGAQGGDRYMAALSKRYGKVAGFKDFARKGAMLTYETYRAIFEGRNARLFAPASGTLLWMSNPAQPSFVWQLYHHDLDPTSAMFGTKKANEPVHIQITPEGTVQVVNTTPMPVRGKVVISVFDERGIATSPPTEPDASSVYAASSTKTDLSFAKGPIVRVRLVDGTKLISENVYWSDDAAFLDLLPKVSLQGSAHRTKRGMTVTLRNPSKTVALMTHLSLRRADGARVLPAFYSDNFVSVFPGESKTITIEGEGGTQVSVDGYNVDGVKGQGLRLNEDARPEPPLPPSPPHVPLPGTILSIDAGGPDVAGPWNADDEFASGGTSEIQSGMVTGSDLPQNVLQSERWGEMSYTIPVPAGAYTVRLVFAEGSQPRAGARRFNVDLGRRRVLEEFDVFAEAGGANRAVVKEFRDVAPDRGGNIVISLRKGTANEPEIRAIQILPGTPIP